MALIAAYTSASGVQAASTYLDVVANNVANSNTTGYKTTQISFKDLLYVGPSAVAGVPTGTQIGLGTLVDAINGLFTQGTIIPTGQQLDIAIDGVGFFKVTLPDGNRGYTRAGNFNVNALGQIVTDEGYILDPPITVPPGASSLTIASNGTVQAVVNGTTVVLGQISLTRFPNPDGLVRIGNTTFVQGLNSGDPITGTPGADGLGLLTQGSLEQSNVELATELVNLIIAQRAFQLNTQALIVETAVLDSAIGLIPL
jgi:flagellar basal-body rod protein FlgG